MTELAKSNKFKKAPSFKDNGAVKQAAKPEKKGKKLPEIETVVKHKKETKWFSYQFDQKVENPSEDKLRDDKTKELFDLADSLLYKDQELYYKGLRQSGGSEAAWLLSVIKTGTAQDRITAMQLQIHESPIHSLPYLEALLAPVEKKHTREVMEIMPLIETIFLESYLPESRKLLSFSSRPLAKLDTISGGRDLNKKKVLIMWMFEHKLKQVYERFIKALEGIASGNIEDLSRKALKTALNLLAERPEAEQILLSFIVNKLGHPNYRLGANVAQLLEELTRRQPNMTAVIVKETERLVYRKNVSEKALLYATTFLSQIKLRNEEAHVPVHLLQIYFGLFKTVVAAKKSDNRLLNILLAASNRAFPFAKDKMESLVDDIDALYKVVHSSSFPVALQTFKLLFQVLNLSDSLSDRFYSALYRKLFTPIPQNCYNQLMLLLFRVLKGDATEDRVRSFIKRLLQIATGAPPSLAAAILILVSRIAEKKPGVLVTKRNSDKVLTQVNFDDDDEDEHFVDIGVDGKPIVKAELKEEKEDDDSDVEEDNDNGAELKKKDITGKCGPSSKGGWLHKNTRTYRSPYDPAARNPLFVDARSYPDTELLLLAKHYHPSVAIFAQQLIQGQFINYRGDPLEDYTLIKFLDRFAYKNPKEPKNQQLEPRVARKKIYDPWGVRKLSVRSKEYIDKKSSEVPPDERYLHKFAKLKFQPKEEEKVEDEWDIESVNSDEFEQLLERFEPGEGNDAFDADFGEEFSAEKIKKKADKRIAEDFSDGENDELDEEDYDDDDGDEENDDDEDGFDDDDDDDDVEMESDSDEERAFTRGKGGDQLDSGSDDEDYGENDVEMAGDRFGAMLEDIEDEHKENKKKGKSSKFQKKKRGGVQQKRRK
ncbi:unnamed protein product [Auanema sp. JU1783]|nr:unnamed protein product [Auanema sp. JU1783]